MSHQSGPQKLEDLFVDFSDDELEKFAVILAAERGHEKKKQQKLMRELSPTEVDKYQAYWEACANALQLELTDKPIIYTRANSPRNRSRKGGCSIM